MKVVSKSTGVTLEVDEKVAKALGADYEPLEKVEKRAPARRVAKSESGEK